MVGTLFIGHVAARVFFILIQVLPIASYCCFLFPVIQLIVLNNSPGGVLRQETIVLCLAESVDYDLW